LAVSFDCAIQLRQRDRLRSFGKTKFNDRGNVVLPDDTKHCQEVNGLLAGQPSRTRDSKAAARANQGFVDIADIVKIGREDDLSAQGLNDPVGDRQEPVQVLIAVGASTKQVIGVLDNQGVVRSVE
jgi:hypothetical protein